MLRTRTLACLVGVAGMLLSLVSATPALDGAAADHPRAVVHPARLVPAFHPSLRVIRVQDRRIVQVHGVVRRARVVPWPGSGGRAAGPASASQLGTQRPGAIRLTAYLAGPGDPPVEYKVPTPGSQPEGVVAKGLNAWFAESVGHKIGKVTQAGVFTEYPVPVKPNNSGSLHSITVGADLKLWFTTYSYIGRVTTTGTFSFFPITRDGYAYDITPGPDGNVWFTEVLGKVGYVTPQGAVTEFAVGSGINPQYITAGPDGALWFTATSDGANYLYRITTTGSLTQYVLPSTWNLNDITAGPDGRLWFDSNTTALTAVTPAGTFTTYTWPLKYPNGYTPQYIRPDGTGALVFACLDDGSIGRMTTSGLVSFTAVPSGNGATGLSVGQDGTIWFSEVTGNAIGLTGPGAAPVLPPA